MKRLAAVLGVVSILAGTASAAEPVSFNRHVIRLPRDGPLNYLLRDLDGDGMTDLLAVSSSGQVFIFRQSSSGFSTTPHQTLQFPECTVCFGVADVSEDPNEEIVISTGNGVAYYRQKDGVFETDPTMLIDVEQVFAGKTVGLPGQLLRNRAFRDSKLEDAIPVTFSDHVVTYLRDDTYQYLAGPRTDMEHEAYVRKEGWSDWNLGGKASSCISVRVRARYQSEDGGTDDEEEQHPYIKELLEKIDKKRYYDYGVERNDINRDGKQDLSFWYVHGVLDPTTKLVIFLRREDGSLPAEPDQDLRCRGIPANWVRTGRHFFSPFIDTNNDGLLDIVFLEMKNVSMSFRSLLEMVTSEGIDWTFAVRLFHPGTGYSRRADYNKDLTGILPILEGWEDTINLRGDFNGDGRPDLMIRRTPRRVDIYCSSRKGDLYSRTPAMRMGVPAKGLTIVGDYNGDAISDILIDDEEGEITLFLSERSTKKGLVR